MYFELSKLDHWIRQLKSFHWLRAMSHYTMLNKCKCKCIRNWPLPIGAFQDQCKQIVINKHSLAKNANWWEADQLAIYKRRREIELGTTENNIS